MTPTTDQWTIHAVVISLAVITLALFGIAGVLAYQQTPIPAELWVGASGSLGLLGGLLANTRSVPPQNPPDGPAAP